MRVWKAQNITGIPTGSGVGSKAPVQEERQKPERFKIY